MKNQLFGVAASRQNAARTASPFASPYPGMVGRVTPCAPFESSAKNSGAHGVTRPTIGSENRRLRLSSETPLRRSFIARLLALAVLAIATARGAEPASQIGLKLLAEGFTAPTVLISLDDGSGRLLVADQA